MILAVIPANDRPHRVPHKNVLPLGGKTTLEWTIEAVQECGRDVAPVVVTNCEKATAIALGHGVAVMPSTQRIVDTDNLIEIMDWALKAYEHRRNRVEAIMLAPACAVIRPPFCFVRLVAALQSAAPDVTCVTWFREIPAEYHPWKSYELLSDGRRKAYLDDHKVGVNRQEYPTLYVGAGIGSIYRRSFWHKVAADPTERFRWNNRALVCTAEEAVEIDEPIDVLWTEFLLQQRHRKCRLPSSLAPADPS